MNSIKIRVFMTYDFMTDNFQMYPEKLISPCILYENLKSLEIKEVF